MEASASSPHGVRLDGIKLAHSWYLLWSPAKDGNGGSELVGLLCTHVDDLLVAGQGGHYERSLSNIAELVKLSFRERGFVYCGKRIMQHSNGTIEVSQKEAVLNVTASELPRHRRRQP